MIGPGKYDSACTAAREATKGAGALLVIFSGEHGDGFSVQAPAATTLVLPRILRLLAEAIERDANAWMDS